MVIIDMGLSSAPMPAPSTNSNRILVIPLRFIGDTVLSVPLLRALRRGLPEAHIGVLASKTAAPLLEPCPYINQVVVEPKGWQARQAILKGYDTAIILRKSASMPLICRLAGTRRVLGYDKQRILGRFRRWGLFLDQTLPFPSLRGTQPMTQSHLAFLPLLGVETPANADSLELWITSQDDEAIDTLFQTYGLNRGEPLAVFHAVSPSTGKNIPLETFLPALQRLHQMGFRILTTGTENDHGLYQRFGEECQLPLLNLAGKTTLRQTVALFRRVQLMLSVDSGPVHLAAAAGIPKMVVVYGPTNHAQWGVHQPGVDFWPVFQDLPCRPCHPQICEHNACRLTLSPDSIESAILKGLDPLK